jgi:hypothetical protein
MGDKGYIRNGTSGSTAVAGDEEETVLTLLEVGVGRFTSPAGNVLHCITC